MDEIKVLKKALLAGGEVLTRYFGRVNYELKGRANLLTEADLKSQQKVIAVIKKARPGHSFLAEEGALPRPMPAQAPYQRPMASDRPFGLEPEVGDLDRKPQASGIKPKGRGLWIIDPLDGTTNYAHTFPVAAVSIGFMAEGRVIAGGVFDPFRKELFLAGRGSGAFLNGRRIKVSDAPKLSSALLVTGFPYDRAEKADFYCSFFSKFMRISHDVRRMGAASLDLAWLAAGRTDGYWEFGLKPWDVAAGGLLVEEAGGKVTDFSGQSWKSLEAYGPQTLATNGKLHPGMLKIIKNLIKTN